MRERDLFIEALQKTNPGDRIAYLDAACAGDDVLRGRVLQLLAQHEKNESFLLDAPAPLPHVPPNATIDQPTAEFSGTVIGPYKLVEQIGEGGMGTVWMAQQTEPIKRLVAVKLTKVGMDSKQVIARFEAERQALALMDHANIARVLDAGTSSAGRPYFVMDLVKGVPITRYCDEYRLTPRQRLELFIPVCQAVQHAHQKGIIHRDLKPSNVLVAQFDGRPVPKIIDFGVAKATGQSLTDKTLVTGFGSIVGTLEYMSPEQAEFNQLDIDTRSDIYSLGVLLYELLAGSPPFTNKDLEKAGMLEMLRLIRDQEPSKPSTKLSTAEGLPTLAANRGTEPAKLTKMVRGELDWIVMKALEKDRNLRYETANGFAMDVQRYLADEPVQACPPSVGYRFRKLARRNRGPVIAATLTFLCLLAGIVGTSTGLLWALRERDAKARALVAETEGRQAKENALAAKTKALEAEKQARETAMTSLRDMTDDIVENQMARATHLTNENKEFLRKIIKHFESFAALTAEDAESRAIRTEGHLNVGLMRQRLGELKEAEAAYKIALALSKQLATDFPTRSDFRRYLSLTQNNLGNLLQEAARHEEAEAAYAEALAIQKQLAADFPTRPDFRQGLARSHNNLGNLLSGTGRLKEAEAAYAEALAIQKQLAVDFPTRPDFRQGLAMSLNGLGNLLLGAGRFKEAEAAYVEALAIQKKLASDFPTRPDIREELAISLNGIGSLPSGTGRLKEAEAAYAEALAIQKQLAADFPTRPEIRRGLAITQFNLGLFHRGAGRLKEAEVAYAEALAIQKQLAADFPTRPVFRHELARTQVSVVNLLLGTGRLKETEAVCADALANLKQLTADIPNKPDYQHLMAVSYVNLAKLNQMQGRYKAAKAYLKDAMPHTESALKASPSNSDYQHGYKNYLAGLIVTQAGVGDRAGALRAAEKLRDLGWQPVEGDDYNAACFLSLCIPIVQKDDWSKKETCDRDAAFYADEAMKMLQGAVARGFKDAAHMKKDKDLNPLREREDFRKLLAELEANNKGQKK